MLPLDLFHKSDSALDTHPFAAGGGKSLSSLHENVPLEVMFTLGAKADVRRGRVGSCGNTRNESVGCAVECGGDASCPGPSSADARSTRKRRSQTHLLDGLDESDMEELQRMDESDPSLGDPTMATKELGVCTPHRQGDDAAAAAATATAAPSSACHLHQPPRRRMRRITCPPQALAASAAAAAAQLSSIVSSSTSSDGAPTSARPAEEQEHNAVDEEAAAFRTTADDLRRSASGEGARAGASACAGAGAGGMSKSSSREKLKKLMSAPVIDWEEVRRVQKSQRESCEDGPSVDGAPSAASASSNVKAAARRATFSKSPTSRGGRPGMYSKSSMMRVSLERLDRALENGLGGCCDPMNAETASRTAAAHRVGATGGPKNRRGLNRHSSWAGRGRRRNFERNASWSNKSADGADEVSAAAKRVEGGDGRREAFVIENYPWDVNNRGTGAHLKNSLAPTFATTEVVAGLSSNSRSTPSPPSLSPRRSSSPETSLAVAAPVPAFAQALVKANPTPPAFLVARHGVAGSLASAATGNAAAASSFLLRRNSLSGAGGGGGTPSPSPEVRSPSPPVFPGRLAGGEDAASIFHTLMRSSPSPPAPAPAFADLGARGLTLTKPRGSNASVSSGGASRGASQGLALSRRPSSKGLALSRQPSSKGLALSRRPSSKGLALARRPSGKGLALVSRPSFSR